VAANPDKAPSGPAGRSASDDYTILTEAMSEGVYDWDIASGDLKVSGRLTAITGLSAAELGVGDWNQRVHPDDFAAYRAAVAAHFKGETGRLVCEYRIRRASGDYLWVADTGRCLWNDTGEAVRLVGAISDITARKLAETKLKAAQQEAESANRQLLDAIESISEGIVLFDRDDRVILCNTNFKRYFAATAGDEVAAMIEPGALFWDFLREAHARGMLPIVEQKGGIDAYIEMRKAMRRNPQEPVEQLLSDGRWLQINEHKTASGGIASVYTDITELKSREVELAAKTEMLESLSSRLSKYLSPQIYSSIFSDTDSVKIAPKRKKLTVFFSDIVGFTSLVDALESEELTSLLNQYLTEMSRIAIEHGATVDKFIGDAIVAFFGDPVSRGTEADARACVAMALAMQARLGDLRRQWRGRGLGDIFELRIGIATGFCTVGNFGSEDRLDYTAIGNPVNLAARLQTYADTGGILLDNETYHLVKGDIRPVEEMELPIKGLTKPVRAFKIAARTAAEEPGLALEIAGVKIRIDSGHLTPRERGDAISVLRAALDELEKTDLPEE